MNRRLIFAYRIILFFLSFLGVYLEISKYGWGMLMYYTVLSLSLIHIQMCIRDRSSGYKAIFGIGFALRNAVEAAVSYTHLDVYKRQGTKIFTTLNLLSPAIADYLLLRRYGRILKKYFG